MDSEEDPSQLEVATQTKEDPAECGRRLAAEVLPKQYSLSAHVVRKTIVKRLSAHVRLPRATGSMAWKFKLDMVPLGGIREICEAAGMELQFPLQRIGSGRRAKTRRTWKTSGANTVSKFASLQIGHPLAWGGAKLVKAPKMAARKVCRAMTLLAPPLTVTHTRGADEETSTISGYLVTYNEAGEMRLPPNHEEIWGTGSATTTKVLKKYAKKMIGNMYVEGMAMSQRMKKAMGPQFESSDEDEEPELAEEEVDEEEPEVEEVEAEVEGEVEEMIEELNEEEVNQLILAQQGEES